MSIRLVPMSAERFPEWLDRSRTEFIADLVATGESPEAAHRQAAEALDGAFPTHGPTATNAVFDVVDSAGTAVGYLWIAQGEPDDEASWWVWDVVIEPGHRGKGLGRATMLLAEEYARSQGAHALGLSVFGFNTAARGLYESLGYEVTSVRMRKRL
ncbi:GNAT family N-acetyltransferase [Arthrobacter burdickii]|jgi:ribosomal protein S18 acetylase RimI-like enzyme|uniref:GNAT family N-acetyltransferase n=1 Tax=Arthrobacter burdickii TaxID=3035920 RepID=A0ABT8JXX5_9MICC|nr:GNAT family N-acetyltransferase [Arthrobacter burdickii]MDN4610016.1 GNAT family N-acetyltransferase [Arthrobacter burdickii]